MIQQFDLYMSRVLLRDDGILHLVKRVCHVIPTNRAITHIALHHP